MLENDCINEVKYNNPIKAQGSQGFEEIMHFLDGIAFGHKYLTENTYYFLDKSHEGIAKLNLKKNTIELTDKVEEWIVDSINHINKQERVR